MLQSFQVATRTPLAQKRLTLNDTKALCAASAGLTDVASKAGDAKDNVQQAANKAGLE